MIPADVLFETNLNSLEMIHRGKVRDIYAIDAAHMLIVTTDRLSAFDVILPDPIPGKGLILNAVSNFWFERFADVVPSQQADMTLEQAVPDVDERALIEGRAIVVKRLKALPIEAIVRGYLIGSGWKDYQVTGQVCGLDLPADLQQAQQLDTPLYTPSSKAAVGEHDENITFEQTVELVGADLANQIRDVSITLYTQAAEYARAKGIIIADTKFEFGIDDKGVLTLIDECLTPDSSRFWPQDEYQLGMSPPSFDKQYVRDYLETLDWDKTPPAPRLPVDVIENTQAKYNEALTRLKG